MRSHCQWETSEIWKQEQQPTRLGLWTIASIKACQRATEHAWGYKMPHSKLRCQIWKGKSQGNCQRGLPQSPQCNRKDKLLKILQEFEELFDGTLGGWDCNLVLLQLKQAAQPYHGRSFPIPKNHVETKKRKSKDYVTWELWSGKQIPNGLCQLSSY